jgi:SAM-dependent methyltransferase
MNDRPALTPPHCPITDQPAVRNVQWIKARFLVAAWKRIMGVNARPSFGAVQDFGLWESPTGLYFFDPMTEGDHEFYSTFYANLIKNGLWSQSSVRKAFNLAASRIAPGQRVLDIGCGFGNFRSVVPHAEYVGLDPNFAMQSCVDGVIDQTLQEHLSWHAGTYDAVCAFEVIEHLVSPTAFFADMVRAARPGGLVILSVPSVHGALTEIPNFLLNAPPHHLTWWTPKALAALAARQGAVVESIESVPWGEDDALIYWMARCSPLRCRKTYYRNVWWWHAAALMSYLGGRLAHKVVGVPKTKTGDEGSGLLMVARRR